LGQILVSHTDAYLIDFEGEPMKPMSERRAKTTPMRDVAGFIRSLDYAAATVGRPDNDASLQPVRENRSKLLVQFRRKATDAFLDAYWEIIDQVPALKLSRDHAALLDLMLIEKASYEILYEAANRPTWLAIPMSGLAELAMRIAPRRAPALAASSEQA
jgi:maltose alpha-D-glucosyltransferase/alpha-amylase